MRFISLILPKIAWGCARGRFRSASFALPRVAPTVANPVMPHYSSRRHIERADGACGHMQRQQMTQRIHGGTHLGAFATFGPSYPARAPDSGVDWRVRLSRIMAVGFALRPANSRSRLRRSSIMISKTPARSKCSRCKASSRHNARYDATKTTPHCLRHSDSLPVACFPSLHTGEISAVRKESALVQVHI